MGQGRESFGERKQSSTMRARRSRHGVWKNRKTMDASSVVSWSPTFGSERAEQSKGPATLGTSNRRLGGGGYESCSRGADWITGLTGHGQEQLSGLQ